MKTSTSSKPTPIRVAKQLVFILGHPLGHTLSPLMHNAAFRSLGIPWAYGQMDISPWEIQRAVECLRCPNVQGANITLPYKEEVLTFLDRVLMPADGLESVNTVFRRGKKLLGTSTDGEGFLRSLGSWRKKLKGSRGLIVGAGGSAKAVSGALARSGVKGLFIVNRSFARAAHLAKLLSKRYPPLQTGVLPTWEGEFKLNQCDWVVQTTPVGLERGDPSPFKLERARPGTLAVDLIYHRETAFLKAGRKQGLPTLGGLGMLLNQGAISFEYWTGQKAPLSVMRKALREGLVST